MADQDAGNSSPQSEQEVRDGLARYRAIFDTAVDGIITIDQRGIVESMNPAAERMFGYAAQEVVGKNVSMLMPAPFKEEHDTYLGNYLETGNKKIIGIGREVVGRRKDGSTFPMDLAVSELSIGGKRMFTGLIRDVTDRKRAEMQLTSLLQRERSARAEAERASKAKDDFLAALSHELRTPLTPALLTLSLLDHDPDIPAKCRPDLEVIRRNVEMEARLIDDLLDLTRVVNRKMTFSFQTVDVHQMIRNAAKTCETGDGIDVALHLDAPEHHVRADPGRLQQVFWNLLNNAYKFTPIGGSISVHTNSPQRGRIRVDVIDTGRGIDPALLPKIFNAFEQGNPQTARSFGGLGLGLAISKAITDAHDASLTATSPGKGLGSTFTVELATAAAIHSDHAEPTPIERAIDKALRVLVVEDHEPTSRVISRLLRQMGHQARIADSVRNAIEISEAEHFDLMISDLGLPDGSGYEVMAYVQKRFGLKGIALSGYGMNEDIQRSLEAGFTQHLTKPVDLQTLMSAVERAYV